MRLQPSCSLQFLPWSLQGEEEKVKAAHPLVWPLLSFATEKLSDLKVGNSCVCVPRSIFLSIYVYTSLQEEEEGCTQTAPPLVWPLLSFATEELVDLRVHFQFFMYPQTSASPFTHCSMKTAAHPS